MTHKEYQEYQSRLLGYAADKRAFVRDNPNFTQRQYDAHIKKLVQKWGI